MTMTINNDTGQAVDRGRGHGDGHDNDRPEVTDHGHYGGHDAGHGMATSVATEPEETDVAAAKSAVTPEITGGNEDSGRGTADTAEKGVAAARSELTAATGNEPSKSTILDGDRSTLNATGEDHGQHVATAIGQSSHRVNPDSRGFMRFLIGGYVSYGLVAFAVSFVAIFHVTGRFGFPIWMQVGIPVAIDLAILINAAVILLFRARGENPWMAWTFLTLFTGLSVFANVAHALALGQESQWEILAAAIIAGSIPVAVFAATEMLAKVAFVNPKARRQEIEDQSQKLADQARLEQEQMRIQAQQELEQQKAKFEQEKQLTELEILKAERERRVAEAKTGAPKNDQEPIQAPTPRPVPRPTATKESAPSRGTAAEQLEEIARFVTERTANGEDTTGKDLKEHGFVGSDRTGRRKLDDLRETRPEIFLEGGDQ